ncbi:glycosyltransferase family 2 protein [Methanosarcina sp. MSH10X1]|uniref:glycosyltransferase family 2 protein n=1 Tax=Methanosarcina sp. MSH10X1 TaxID=2507075 RepID=UPI000FFBCC05|nr:glycosyltransferase family 2 protein [Methanosarcina sp. MSH10X1]RXA19709.1 glycosyltransferase family 2 protein [Methanosarcina sp. MSH10X1]
MKYPFISIVVGIRNEERFIEECIESLLNLDYPRDSYEIIIVDGMSTDKTRDIVQKYPVKLLLNERKNVAAARNLGVKNARGELVAFTDGDCKVDPQWLKALIREMQEAPDDVVCFGGPNLIFDTDPVFGRVVGYAQESFLGSGGSAQSKNSTKKHYVGSLPNCNAMYKKVAIQEAGGFDERFVVGQDGDLNYRIGKKGNRFLYIPEAQVLHHRRGTLKSFSLRMFKYGMWMAELFKKHGEFVRWYAFLPSIAILFAATLLIASIKYYTPGLILLALTALYFVLVIITSIQVTYKMRSKYGLFALFIIPVQHIAYGLGFLYSFTNSPLISKTSSCSDV